MRKELEELAWIEAALEGNLTEKEQVAFDKKRREDPGLHQSVILQQIVQERVKTIALYEQIQIAHQKFIHPLPGTGTSIITWLLGGLTFFSLIFTGIVYYNVYNRPETEITFSKIPAIQEGSLPAAPAPVIPDSSFTGDSAAVIAENLAMITPSGETKKNSLLYTPNQSTPLQVPLKENCRLVIPGHLSFTDADGNITTQDIQVVCDYKGYCSIAGQLSLPAYTAPGVSLESPLYQLKFTDPTGKEVYPDKLKNIKVSAEESSLVKEIRYLQQQDWKTAPNEKVDGAYYYKHIPDGYKYAGRFSAPGTGTLFFMYQPIEEGPENFSYLTRQVNVHEGDTSFSTVFKPSGPFWHLMPRQTAVIEKVSQSITRPDTWIIGKQGYFIICMPETAVK